MALTSRDVVVFRDVGASRIVWRVIEYRYSHTNLVAHDWQRLAKFYTEVFGCEPVGPQRDLSGDWLDKAIGVPGAHLQGTHLRLPGHGDRGPTLELFTYDHVIGQPPSAANRAGYGHIAFEVLDVAVALDRVVAHGGEALGSVTTTTVSGMGDIELTYARDPEGNIIELQRWR